MKTFSNYPQTLSTRLLFLIFLFFVNTLFAQKNYIPGLIIDNDNDTISGLINYQNWAKNPKTIEFRKFEGSQSTIFSPLKIKAFHVAKDIYLSKIAMIDKSPFKTAQLVYKNDINRFIVSDTVFLEVLIHGETNLYSLLDENSKEHFFIHYKDFDGELIYRRYLADGDAYNLKKYRSQLSYVFQDCPSVSESIIKTNYKKEDLIKIVSKFNTCISTGNTYTKIPDKIKLETAIIGGISASSVSFESENYFTYLTNSDFGYSVMPVIGLSLNISFPKNRRKWSLYNELSYTQYSLSASITEKEFNLYTDNDINFDASYLKLSTLIRYSFKLPSKVQPFINLGLTNGIAIKNLNARHYESYFLFDEEKIMANPSSVENAINDFRKYEQGLALGLGGKVKKCSFEFRYESTNGFSEYQTLSSSVKTFYFIVGYWF